MNVFILLERLDQRFILGKVSEDSQFNLGIVCRSDPPSLLRNEGLTNPISLLCPDGNVLEVGITRGEPSRGGHRLVVRRVDPSGLRMNQFGKGIDVSGFEFAQVTITEDLQGKLMLKRQFGQDIDICGIAGLGLLDHGQFQFIEEDLPQLLGGVDIEDSSPARLIDALLSSAAVDSPSLSKIH